MNLIEPETCSESSDELAMALGNTYLYNMYTVNLLKYHTCTCMYMYVYIYLWFVDL